MSNKSLSLGVNSDSKVKKPKNPLPTLKESKSERLAQALRNNLRRRKAPKSKKESNDEIV